MQFDCRLVPNLYLNVKYEILRKMSNYFKGRNFRGQKLSRVKKTRNLWNKLSRFAVFGTNFVEKTFANRGKSLFSREKTFANEQKK